LSSPLSIAAAGCCAALAIASLSPAVAAEALFAVAPAQADAASLERGARLFEGNCAACHAGGGNVIVYARGRNLTMKKLERYGYADAQSIGVLLREGRGAMPVYGTDRLSDQDVEDVSAFTIDAATRRWK
jgi:cytochrome c6